MSDNRTEGFLGRWSRLKRGEQPEEAAGALNTASDQAADTPFDENARQAGAERLSGDTGESAPEPAKDFSDFDFDALSFESDYKQFMGAGVPDDVRNTALRKLWLSNPVLANVDGLDDYCEDYTDAAMCLPKGTMKTAYRFGRGFLSDAEVAQWEALGQPAQAVAASDSDALSVAEASQADAAAETAAAAAAGEEAVADPSDWVESAATSGAGCAAALKTEELAAEMEEDAAEAASDAQASPTLPSRT